MNQEKIQYVLQKAVKDIVPSDSERQKVKGIINFTKKSIEEEIKNEKIDAEVVVGGSVGKDTWLKGNSDVDFFIRFDKKHKDERVDILLGTIVKSVFTNVKVAHGSRDYYKVNYKGHELEFIPVLKIEEPTEAENTMDVSPFHVKYVRNNSRVNNIGDQIRLLKAFAKSQKFYGAETFTSGLSGYVSELLIIHFGSFYKFLEFFETAQPKIVIDTEKQYKNSSQILKLLPDSKLKSPIVLIDPIMKSRNAAAALNYDTFAKMLFSIRLFLRQPSTDFFALKEATIEKIKKQSKTRGSILVTTDIKIKEDTLEDVFLAKIQKKIEHVEYILEKEGINIYKKGYVKKKNKLTIYFELETLKLSKYFKHHGPPVWIKGQYFDEFISKHKNVYVSEGSLTVDMKRKYTDIKSYALSVLKEEFKNV